MQTAYMNLVRYALAKSCTISVWDGEEWQVKRSASFRNIVNAIKSVDEATIKIRDVDGDFVGAAFVSAYGLLPEETVIDWTDNDWMEAWYVQYDVDVK